MDERDEAPTFRVTLAVEPAVVVDESGEQLGQKRAAVGSGERLGDMPDGDGRERRLRDARRLDITGSIGMLLRLPYPTAPDVASALGEDDVRQHAVGPLPSKERTDFPGGASRVSVCEAHGDEARIPQPLVRIADSGRTRPRAPSVALEHFQRAPFEIRTRHSTALGHAFPVATAASAPVRGTQTVAGATFVPVRT